MRELRDRTKRVRKTKEREVKRQLILAFEGINTEPEYFDQLKKCSDELGFSPLIKIVLLEKYENEKGISNPQKLLELLLMDLDEAATGKIILDRLLQRIAAEASRSVSEFEEQYKKLSDLVTEKTEFKDLDQKIDSAEIEPFINTALLSAPDLSEDMKDHLMNFTYEPILYNTEIDTPYLITDRDQKSFKEEQYDSVVSSCESHKIMFCPTNPCFELWLLLHYRKIFLEKENELFLANPKMKEPPGKRKNRTYSEIQLREFIKNYSKKEGKLADHKIVFRLSEAMQNAAELPSNPKELKNKIGSALPILIKDLGWMDSEGSE